MGIIGIAANPASGKDIRRLVSHATVFDNNEKTNIVQRIVMTAAQMGNHDIYLMPDRYNFAARIIRKSERSPEQVTAGLFSILDMPSNETAADTTEFARRMAAMEASVLVVLGGDGTCRAAAKAVGNVPMIPISTGTNNAFPTMQEGTSVGMAAAVLASGVVDASPICAPSKRIEIYRDGELIDIALIDAVFTRQAYGGTKAVWDISEITRVIVTSCRPAGIGFSSLLGSSIHIHANDDFGAIADVSTELPNRHIPFSAGIIQPAHISNVRVLPLDEPITVITDNDGMIALDGEKEVTYRKGEHFLIRITRNGPRVLDVEKALTRALELGFYKIGGEAVKN